jgi:hypothetical protein
MTSSERAWRTSSYSGTQGGNCVEVAGHDGMILVRDTKNREGGHAQAFTAAGWRAFVASVQGGTFDPDESGRLLNAQVPRDHFCAGASVAFRPRCHSGRVHGPFPR